MCDFKGNHSTDLADRTMFGSIMQNTVLFDADIIMAALNGFSWIITLNCFITKKADPS